MFHSVDIFTPELMLESLDVNFRKLLKMLLWCYNSVFTRWSNKKLIDAFRSYSIQEEE